MRFLSGQTPDNDQQNNLSVGLELEEFNAPPDTIESFVKHCVFSLTN